MADSSEIFDPRDLDGIAAPGNAPNNAPNNAPASHPWHPGFTRKQAAAALGCSDSLIRKRLKQLEAFHSEHALIAADGSISETGFIAIERLGRLGIAEYRQQYSQRIAARQLPPARQLATYRTGTGAIVPEVLDGSSGSGAIAIANDLDLATAALNQARDRLAARRAELQARSQARDRDLGALVGAAKALQSEQAQIAQLETIEAARDAAAEMVRATLGNAAAAGFGGQ